MATYRKEPPHWTAEPLRAAWAICSDGVVRQAKILETAKPGREDVSLEACVIWDWDINRGLLNRRPSDDGLASWPDYPGTDHIPVNEVPYSFWADKDQLRGDLTHGPIEHALDEDTPETSGKIWNYQKVSTEDVAQMLISAQATYAAIHKFAPSPYFDFSSILNLCSKALEEEIRQRVFLPFKASELSQSLPQYEEQPVAVRRSRGVLARFVEGRSGLSLGQMAVCLKHLGCRMSYDRNNGFARFLDRVLANPRAFCREDRLPWQLDEFVRTYRNPASHGEILTFQDLEKARAFLFETPQALFYRVLEAFRQE